MKLELFTSIKLDYKKPFSFEKTFYIPSHFPSKLEYYSDNIYYIPMDFKGEIIGLKFYINENLFVDIFSSNVLSEKYITFLLVELDFRFTLTMDYGEFYDRHREDRFLASVINRNYGKHISNIYSLYQSLIVSIFLQNTTIKRTITMCENMLKSYAIPIEFDGIELYAFWDIENFNPTDEELREQKVGYRSKNIIRLTKYFQESRLDDEMLRDSPTADLVKELLKIYGVGKQTVYYLVAGQFHRTEYLKHIPLWERKILSRYIFDKKIVEETVLINWFKNAYGAWCGFALTMIFEDIFYQHNEKPFDWLSKILNNDKS